MTLRDELVRIVDAKVCPYLDGHFRYLSFTFRTQNAYTEQCMRAVRRISALNTDLVQLPPALSNLKANLRGKNSFSHIQRLHNMLYAYGATVIEIVRRKEFSKFESLIFEY
jgi:autophagy-related protein 11